MRKLIVVLWVLLCSIPSAGAQVSFGIETPGLSIGINVPVYPQLVRVPGYPVYYAPQANGNYFFYDGMYWVYQQDNWYASSWYNGPWALASPEAVPYFVLRIPVRYYRRPPAYFHGWSSNAPPRWGEHWGNSWAQSRQGWDNWDRGSVPAPAPLPIYQRQYSGTKYPRAEQQYVIQSQNYRYQPHEAVVQQHYQAQQAQRPPASPGGQQPQAVTQQKAQQQQEQAATPQKAQQQQREAASQQKAQQQAQPQQKAQQQQQREAASQQKAQQQQAQTQQKAQQQQQREAASQQKAQQREAQSSAEGAAATATGSREPAKGAAAASPDATEGTAATAAGGREPAEGAAAASPGAASAATATGRPA